MKIITQTVCCKHPPKFTDWLPGSTFTYHAYISLCAQLCVRLAMGGFVGWHFECGHCIPSSWQSSWWGQCHHNWKKQFPELQNEIPNCNKTFKLIFNIILKDQPFWDRFIWCVTSLGDPQHQQLMLEGKHIGKLCAAGSKLPAFAWIRHIIGSCCDADLVAHNIALQCVCLCVLHRLCVCESPHNYSSGG